jgi:hypothetical protein
MAAVAMTLPMAANAAQVSLAPANVYASSFAYSGTYLADNILDQQTGAINETAQDGSYWLHPDYDPAPAFISIDLGAQYRLGSFDLFNTHNAGYNDRGTGNFTIRASNDSTFATFVTVASGTLTAEQQGTPLSAQTYASSSNALFQYIQFRATSVAAQTNGGAGYNFSAYGLNELRVFDAAQLGVPEPAQWALMIGGFGLIGAASRRRRLAVA